MADVPAARAAGGRAIPGEPGADGGAKRAAGRGGNAYRAVVVMTIVAGAWMMVQAARMAWQPLFLDEVDFLNATADWPVHAAFVPHPPGFVYLLRLLFATFGRGANVARLPGLVSALATLALLPALASALVSDRARAPRAAAFAVAVFGLAPLATQNAVLVDIDNTLMTPVLVGLFLLWHHGRSWTPWLATTLFAAALAAALWLKLPPPPMLALALVLASVAVGAWRRAAGVAGGAIAGAVLAVVTLALFSNAMSFLLWTVSANAHRVGGASGLRAILVRAPQTAGTFVLWLGLPWTLLSLWAVARTARVQGAAREPWIAAVLFVAATVAFYTLFLPPAYGYPKYQSVALPFMAALAGALVAGEDDGVPVRALVAAALVAFAAQFALGDTLWRVYRVSFTTGVAQLGARLAATRSAFALAAVPLASALAVTALLRGRARRLAPVLLAGLVAAAAGAGGALLWKQAGADYSTRYAYTAEPRALLAAARCVRAGTAANAAVLAPKDVLYHAGRQGRFVSDLIWEGLPPDSLVGALREHRYAAIVWTTKDQARATSVLGDARVQALLAGGFMRSAFGDWIVWVARSEGHALRVPAGTPHAEAGRS